MNESIHEKKVRKNESCPQWMVAKITHIAQPCTHAHYTCTLYTHTCTPHVHKCTLYTHTCTPHTHIRHHTCISIHVHHTCTLYTHTCTPHTHIRHHTCISIHVHHMCTLYTHLSTLDTHTCIPTHAYYIYPSLLFEIGSICAGQRCGQEFWNIWQLQYTHGYCTPTL